MSLERGIYRQDILMGEGCATGGGGLALSLPFESEQRAGGVCTEDGGGSGLRPGSGFRGMSPSENFYVTMMILPALPLYHT